MNEEPEVQHVGTSTRLDWGGCFGDVKAFPGVGEQRCENCGELFQELFCPKCAEVPPPLASTLVPPEASSAGLEQPAKVRTLCQFQM
jgi:hypothetical protein